MKRLYLGELVRLQSGKYLEIYMIWDAVKIQNLSFRDRVILNDNTFILQEINAYDIADNKSTKTYLKYDFREPDAEDNIENTIVPATLNQE